jgi:organic radical activating enzyme
MQSAEYRPSVLGLMLTTQCNIACDHCIVSASPRTKGNLSEASISSLISQAQENGMNHTLLYGGEPFLRIRDTLPFAVEETFKNNMDVTIGTNGFWGKSEPRAQSIISDLEALGARYKRTTNICLSIDSYHAKFIPTKSIANIVNVFRRGEFPHVSMAFSMFDTVEDDETYWNISDTLRKSGIALVESNDITFAYPALPEELIRMSPENYPRVKEKLKLPEYASDKWMWHDLITKAQFEQPQRIIAREFTYNEDQQQYLIFSDERYKILITVDDVINAGRASKYEKQEIHTSYALQSNPYILIAPDGNAYQYPAQIHDQISGVSYENKPLSNVIFEVGQATKSLF